MITHVIAGAMLHYPDRELISGSHSSNHKVWWRGTSQQNCYSLLFFSVGKQSRKTEQAASQRMIRGLELMMRGL